MEKYNKILSIVNSIESIKSFRELDAEISEKTKDFSRNDLIAFSILYANKVSIESQNAILTHHMLINEQNLNQVAIEIGNRTESIRDIQIDSKVMNPGLFFGAKLLIKHLLKNK